MVDFGVLRCLLQSICGKVIWKINSLMIFGQKSDEITHIWFHIWCHVAAASRELRQICTLFSCFQALEGWALLLPG